MTPRASVFTFHVGCQGVSAARPTRRNLNNSAAKLRVITRNVGGSFGMKAQAYPEYVCLCTREAARAAGEMDRRALLKFPLRQPWRDHEKVAELALDADGHFLAIRLAAPAIWALSRRGRAAAADHQCRQEHGQRLSHAADRSFDPCVFTNTSYVSAYRGAGRPEGNYFMERLIDAAAREMGIDRLELRRRNLIKRSEIPYAAASDQTYDSGDFPSVFRDALELADWKALQAASATARSAASCAHRGRQLSGGDGAAQQGDGRHSLRPEAR